MTIDVFTSFSTTPNADGCLRLGIDLRPAPPDSAPLATAKRRHLRTVGGAIERQELRR